MRLLRILIVIYAIVFDSEKYKETDWSTIRDQFNKSRVKCSGMGGFRTGSWPGFPSSRLLSRLSRCLFSGALRGVLPSSARHILF